MKPLQTLDLAMLWMARGMNGFFLSIFGLITLMFFVCCFFYVMIILSHPAADFENRSWGSLSDGYAPEPYFFKDPSQLLILTYNLLWFVCLRSLQSKVARICLALTAGFFGLLIAYGFGEWLFNIALGRVPFSTFGAVFSFFMLLGCVGFISMVWVAIRPPLQSPPPFENEPGHFGHPA
jgi:hypothetical protein